MAGSTYLPSRESELVTWSNTFQSTIVSAAADFGLTDKQAGDYTTAQTAFVSAYQVANNSATRTPSNIETKNEAKQDLIVMTRELVKIAQASPVMTNQKRIDLGITVPSPEPTPVPVPDTMPRITFLPSSGLKVNLKINDVDETKRGKPPEAAAAMIYSYIGASAPLDITQWQFQGASSKVVHDVTFPLDTPSGALVWFTAVWVNRKMQPGPASQPVSINIAGGGVQSKAA